MKILHLHDSPHILGGATQYLRQLTHEMAPRGLKSCFFSMEAPFPKAVVPESAGAQSHFDYRWPKSALRRNLDFHHFHRPLADALSVFIDKERPDLVHIQNWVPFRRTVFRTIQYKGLPLVMTVHDFTIADPHPNKSYGPHPFGAAAYLRDALSHRLSQNAIFSAGSTFLCPTQALMDGIPFPPGKAMLQRLPIALTDNHDLPNQGLRLFFAGTLFRSKGVDLLLQAMSMTKGSAQQMTLEIAGTGDQEDSLKEQVKALGLFDRVSFLGHLNSEEMDAAYIRSHLQVLPSRVPENSPLTVLEAGARGRASLASHDGGVPELIGANRGWTFQTQNPDDLARKLNEIAEKPSALLERGQNMRKWVRANFDPTRHWDEIHSHYKRLISARA